jgi:methionine-rich copper-binding protein CopC
MKKHYLFLVLAAFLPLLVVAVVTAAGLEVEQVEPEEGSTQSRPPHHLRMWFDQAPDPEKAELQLEGPEGELALEGLHTMGEDDLMVRIVGRVSDGEYTAKWKVTDAEGEDHEGEWTFTVKRGG